MGLKHAFKSEKPDPVDSTIIGATKWNDDHYFLDADELPIGAVGDLPYRGTDGLVTLLSGAQGILTSAGSGNVPAWSMSPVLTAVKTAAGGLQTLDTNASHYLKITAGSDLTADRTYTIVTGDANRTVTLSGNPTLSDWFDQSVKSTASPTFSAPTVTSITIGSASIDGTDAAKIDGITNGTVTASKALVVDANKDLSSLRNLTITGTFTSGAQSVGGNITFSTGNSFDIGATGANRPRSIYVGTALHVQQGGSVSIFVGADSGASTVTDATQKVARIGLPHYLNAEEPVAIIVANADNGANTLSFGGATGAMNAAQTLRFFTAANSTTTTGTERWQITSNGHFVAGADATYDIGGNVATRPRTIYAASSIHVQKGDGICFMSGADSTGNTLTDATIKIGRSAVPHYLTAEEPIGLVMGRSDNVDNTVAIGGGTSLVNAATNITFYTAANTTTTTGTPRWSIDITGTFYPGTSNSWDIGGTVNRVRRLFMGEYIEGTEQTAPGAPAANGFRLFAQDNGAGKTQLMVIFSSGAAQQIAIQP